MRSVFAPVLVVLAALVGSLARWGVQGSDNLYTALHKRFYVPDPDLGWRVSARAPIWVGLEVCAVIAALAVAMVIGGMLIHRIEKRRAKPARGPRVASWLVALAPLAVPIAAFASGGAPAGARDTLPATTAVTLDNGIHGSLAAPAGDYEVVANAGSVITAQLSAGGETFDARFGVVHGTWSGAPKDLGKPSRASIKVRADSVDTGIGERSTHAREGYLHADKYPDIAFTLGSVTKARQDSPSVVAFEASGAIELIGKTHAVAVTGTMTQVDAAGAARLGVTAGGAVLLVKATFSIPIRETALAPDAGDFDGDKIPILVSLVLDRSSS